jgi:hypothetical protein
MTQHAKIERCGDTSFRLVIASLFLASSFAWGAPNALAEIPNISCEPNDSACDWKLLSMIPSQKYGTMAILFKRLHLVPDPGVDAFSVPRDWWAKKVGNGDHIQVIFDIGNNPEGCLSGFRASWTRYPGTKEWVPDPMSPTSFLSGPNPEGWVRSVRDGCSTP